MKTQGHCANNGGIRGHSAGDHYPVRVVAKGMPHSEEGVTWHVVLPDGTELKGYTGSDATARVNILAGYAKSLWNRGRSINTITTLCNMYWDDT